MANDSMVGGGCIKDFGSCGEGPAVIMYDNAKS